MRNPFPENPVFEQFLGLKDYFRKYISKESVRRTRELTDLARLLQSTGDKIAFDILGSVNFGMADEDSDVDIVTYIDCGHEEEATYENTPILRFYESLIITTILREISSKPFKTQMVDFINLRRLDKAINEHNFDDDILARFVFYRTICRGVHKRTIRSYERRIMADRKLFSHIESKLTECLVEFTKSFGHNYSFNKYINRLKDRDIKIPDSIMNKVRDYLETSREDTPQTGK